MCTMGGTPGIAFLSRDACCSLRQLVSRTNVISICLDLCQADPECDLCQEGDVDEAVGGGGEEERVTAWGEWGAGGGE